MRFQTLKVADDKMGNRKYCVYDSYSHVWVSKTYADKFDAIDEAIYCEETVKAGGRIETMNLMIPERPLGYDPVDQIAFIRDAKRARHNAKIEELKALNAAKLQAR